MNPWLFIHSLWVRDPRDRAHLKALWARDERQRGLMRWLVLMTLPAMVLGGVIDSYGTLVAAWMSCCYALCHIWSCEDVNGAEFEAILPARARLRLQVLFLGAWLPMIFITAVTWSLCIQQIEAGDADLVPFQTISPMEWLLALSFAILVLTAINWVLRHRILRIPLQFIASTVGVPFMGMNQVEFMIVLGGAFALTFGLHLCAARREVPVNAVEDFTEKKSLGRLSVAIVAILIPSLSIFVVFFYGILQEAPYFNRQHFFGLLIGLTPLLAATLLPYLLIRFRPFCRRYFYVATLLVVVAAMLYRYYLTIMPPGGF